MQNKLTAYDYATQQWVTGEQARWLLRKQIQQHLDLLCHETEGQAYWDWIRHNDDTRSLAAAITDAKNALGKY